MTNFDDNQLQLSFMSLKLRLFVAIFFFAITGAFGQKVLKVAVVGLNHDHVHLLFNLYQQKKVEILGIAEPDGNLVKRMQARYNLPTSLFYKSLNELLMNVKPMAVLAYNPTSEHVNVAEICMPLKIPVMVEKPLAVNMDQAERIGQLAKENKTLFLTNYETTWYKSNQYIKSLIKQNEIGPITKMMVKDGHEGPKEIGCSNDFLNWLTDPVKNGGGALMDFGCYGANLMTWLKDGKKPVAVTAITKNRKPAVYPKVDDDATITLEYEDGTIGIIQASWCWPYSVKDLQIVGERDQLHAVNNNMLLKYQSPIESEKIPLTNTYYEDQLEYLTAVLNQQVKIDNDLSSLDNNLIVVEILEAAKKSAKEGKRIVL